MGKTIVSVLALTAIFLTGCGAQERAEASAPPANPFCETQDATQPVAEPQGEGQEKFDEEGIPLKYQAGQYVYNPVHIAQYALLDRDNVMLVADWLLKTQDCDTGQWFYHFDFPVGGTSVTLEAPWASAMAQGEGISVLTYAYDESGEEKYLDAAEFALEPLKVDVEEGGLKQDFFGHDFYEEYPTDPPSYTLNGFMFALLGLHDLAQASPNSDAQALYDEGLKTLIYALPFYDQGDTSAYHLGHLFDPPRKVHTSPRYHVLHVKQLKRLNEISSDPVLQYYHNLWQWYITSDPEKWEGVGATFVYE